MSDKKFSIRFASVEDIHTIMRFIKELAVYENLEDELKVTDDILKKGLFEEKRAEVIIGFENNVPVGHAIFFETFSTFVGRNCLYLDDLYINNNYRGLGYGKKLFKAVAKIAQERKCGRFEWQCLDWNKSSIDFYLSAGAKVVKDARVYRLTEHSLNNFLSYNYID